MSQFVKIVAGASLSTATKIGDSQRLFSMWTEDAWDAADLAIEVAEEEDGTFLPLCKDETGTPEYLFPFDTAKRVSLDTNVMGLAGISGWVRFRSVAVGDATTLVPQTTAVTISLDVKD